MEGSVPHGVRERFEDARRQIEGGLRVGIGGFGFRLVREGCVPFLRILVVGVDCRRLDDEYDAGAYHGDGQLAQPHVGGEGEQDVHRAGQGRGERRPSQNAQWDEGQIPAEHRRQKLTDHISQERESRE